MSDVKKPARRKRDPDSTRAAILDAACELLAEKGPEGLSVSQVAQRAKVNRGTAYQHFQTREQLLEATTAWVSENLLRAVFGDGNDAQLMDPAGVAEHLAGFVMENPEMCRAWLFEVLRSSQPSRDPFWNEYKARLEGFAASEYAQPGIDVEVHSVQGLVGAFLWPIWARAHTKTTKERQDMARRYAREALRAAMYGSMRPEKFPELAASVTKAAGRKR